MMLYTTGIFLFLCSQYAQAEINMTGCTSRLPPYHIDTSQKGDLYSPGYGEGVYPDYLYCEYHFRAPPGKKIKLTFKDIDVQPLDHCGKDRLYIYDGPDNKSPIYGIYCGTEVPDVLISGRNAMYILFVTDFLVGGKGFHIQYESMPRDAPICPQGYHECQNNRCYESRLKCDGKDDCGDGTDEEQCNLPVPSTTCGISSVKPVEPSSDGRDRVIGGIEVREGSWPWQADMQIKYYHPNGHSCGGTLIHPQWVMTATHCLRGHPYAEDWRIHLGNHHKFIRDSHEQIRHVERIVMYPGYTGEDILGKSVDLNHDLTLMKLNAPVKITDYVKPACLPQQDLEIPDGTTCVSTGWGETRGSGSSEKLKQVDLTTLPMTRCGDSNNATKICVKSKKGYEDVCHGDSGGPLVCKFGNVWNVMGITSYGIDSNMMSGLCALGKSGTVFNRVAAKSEWIDEIIEKYS